MERTSIRLGGVELAFGDERVGSAIGERGEIYELCAVHSGAIVFKSCNRAGLDTPENLKNRGVEFFQSIATELSARNKRVIGSVVGVSEDEFVDVARMLDRAGVSIVELNLADDYVTKSAAPFASFERLKSLARPSSRRDSDCVLAVKAPPRSCRSSRARSPTCSSRCASLLPYAPTICRRIFQSPSRAGGAGPSRTLSQAHAFFKESESLLDVVAVGGINTGRDAYIAHLTGAKAMQVGSALMKEGAGALGRIDRELDSMLGEHGHKSVSEIVGKVRFTG